MMTSTCPLTPVNGPLWGGMFTVTVTSLTPSSKPLFLAICLAYWAMLPAGGPGGAEGLGMIGPLSSPPFVNVEANSSLAAARAAASAVAWTCRRWSSSTPPSRASATIDSSDTRQTAVMTTTFPFRRCACAYIIGAPSVAHGHDGRARDRDRPEQSGVPRVSHGHRDGVGLGLDSRFPAHRVDHHD